jgi:hypothetical protein
MGWTGVRRAQQFNGNAGDADLVIPQLPTIFPEVKRVQRLNVAEAMDKAAEQCKGKYPVLFHRTNRAKNGWLVTVRLTDLEMVAKFISIASRFSQRERSEACSENGSTSFPTQESEE